ncbi:MAG: hypothetical protein KH754_22475, partial [Bacteroides ovatus]|nr:hypothetical protein [Bacteroides ovatus]
TKKQTYLQLLIGLRKKKTVEIKKRLPPNLTKNHFSYSGEAIAREKKTNLQAFTMMSGETHKHL